ncbi:MAG TPA: hypothetical protein PLU24_01020 [Candidatus Omnitrophota bacterium]|nr:hypothetical protein [Candidatus Omnitrophota bacterium]
MSSKKSIIILSLVILFPCLAFAQNEHHLHMGKPMSMRGMYGEYEMTRESSGTSWEPGSSPFEGAHFISGNWMAMTEGYVNAIYDRQTGKRGDEKTFSTSTFMFMAQTPFAKGTFGFKHAFPGTSHGERRLSAPIANRRITRRDISIN